MDNILGKKRFYLPFALVLVALLLIGGGLLATKVWNPSWNPFGGGATKVIEDAFAKTNGAKSFKMEGEINAEAETEGKFLTVGIVFSEDVDKKEAENPKTAGEFKIKLGIEGMTLEVKSEIIGTNKDVYFRLTSLPAIPLLSGLDLTAFKNQWYKISSEELKAINNVGEGSFDYKKFAEELVNLLKDKEVFKIEKNFGVEEIKGEKATHYRTSLKKKTVKEFIPSFLDLAGKYTPAEQQENYQQQLKTFLQNFSKNFEEAWSRIEPLNFDFWLADGYLKELKFEKEFVYESTEKKGEMNKIKIAVNLFFSGFNEKLTIEPPKNFKTLKDILSVLGNFLPTESQ